MGIALNNTGDSGSVNITLNYIVAYSIIRSTKYATKGIPAKSTPTMDTDTYVVYPSTYRIRVYVNNADKAILETLNSEKTSQCKLSDGLLSNKNTRVENVTFAARPGYKDGNEPWNVLIELKGEDN